VEALTPKQREAVRLRYFEHLSAQETAERLGCTPERVDNLCSEAKNKLRDALNGRLSSWLSSR
jgi:RNA polymerase sigma factor (sigma-70 family)